MEVGDSEKQLTMSKWESVPWSEIADRAAELVEDMRQAELFIPLGVPASPEKVASFFQMFQCQHCRDSCCIRETRDGIKLLPNDIKRLCLHLKISSKQFKQKFTFTRQGERFLKHPCPFFHDGDSPSCGIYSARPVTCQLYPVNKPGSLILLVHPHCPGGRLVAEKIIKYQAQVYAQEVNPLQANQPKTRTA